MSGLGEVEQRVTELENRVAELESQVESDGFEIESSGLEELIDQFNPSTHVERATVIGYHLERHLDKDEFTIEDIRTHYAEAKFLDPANFSDVLANAEGKGLMRRSGKTDDYQLWELSRDGLKLIEEGMEE